MKHFFDLTILGIAITFSVFLYRNNTMREVDQLDELKAALADLRNNLGYGSKIGCVVNTNDVPITKSRIANAMAPVSVVLENPDLDSTLFVFDGSWPDSAVDATIGFRRKVWQAASANLKHVFTVNR